MSPVKAPAAGPTAIFFLNDMLFGGLSWYLTEASDFYCIITVLASERTMITIAVYPAVLHVLGAIGGLAAA
jgi:hypothetical protein